MVAQKLDIEVRCGMRGFWNSSWHTGTILVPVRVQALLKRCFEKDRGRRIRNIATVPFTHKIRRVKTGV